tara:strand:+ start:140 stop:658 length:519 start_codon:yes stop_codon:yes gene_type:complete
MKMNYVISLLKKDTSKSQLIISFPLTIVAAFLFQVISKLSLEGIFSIILYETLGVLDKNTVSIFTPLALCALSVPVPFFLFYNIMTKHRKLAIYSWGIFIIFLHLVIIRVNLDSFIPKPDEITSSSLMLINTLFTLFFFKKKIKDNSQIQSPFAHYYYYFDKLKFILKARKV